MFLPALSSLRASTSSLFALPRLLPSAPTIYAAVASSSRSYASYVELGNLSPAPGSHRDRMRVGRGPGSQKGGTSGRGHKGARARSGKRLPYVGFEGGQTPLYKRIPKRGFFNFTSKSYAALPLSRLQAFLAQSRISDSEPITIQTVVHSNLVHGISGSAGVKLLGEPDPNLPLPPLTVYLSRFSKSAARAILGAGGEIRAVYHNRLSLRQEVFPRKFEGREVRMARPTRRNDIEYYTNPKKYGYLAEERDGFQPAPYPSELMERLEQLKLDRVAKAAKAARQMQSETTAAP